MRRQRDVKGDALPSRAGSGYVSRRPAPTQLPLHWRGKGRRERERGRDEGREALLEAGEPSNFDAYIIQEHPASFKHFFLCT